MLRAGATSRGGIACELLRLQGCERPDPIPMVGKDLAERARPLQLILVLFQGHAHQLAARSDAGFFEQGLQDGLDVALRNL